MKSGLRTGILSDEAVYINCPDQQTIPFNKINLAARSGTKISRPQKASYMFNNLNLSQSQKEELIRDFVLRSQKAKPLVIPQRKYSTVSFSKENALVKQVATQPGGGVSVDIHNQIIQQLAQSSAQLTQTQNELRLQKYSTRLMSATTAQQKQALSKLINDLPDNDKRQMAYSTFGVSDIIEFERKLKTIGKPQMTQHTVQVVENLIKDPDNTIDPDNYFSDSAITTVNSRLSIEI